MFNRSAKKTPPIRSLIAQGSIIEGNLRFSDGLRVDGKIAGDLSATLEGSSLLVVSETACVAGEVRADHVIVNGVINGPIYAKELLELQPKAQIHGDVHYKVLEMHQGAVISGQLRPMSQTEEKPVLKLAANNG